MEIGYDVVKCFNFLIPIFSDVADEKRKLDSFKLSFIDVISVEVLIISKPSLKFLTFTDFSNTDSSFAKTV